MSTSIKDLYTRAGITDLAEFYRTKFLSDEVLDARYFKPLDRFDMRFARTMWVYDNVRAGSTVLDLGCGAGMLALLKRKRVTLTGVDLSAECSLAARRNGYDATFTAKLSSLPLPDASFDYVVSLDVLGHVGFDEKDQVLAEIKRVLRPGGVTMHGIECTDRATQKRYEEMTPDEHRDRRGLYATADNATSLDRSPAVTFDDGWYEPNLLPPVARWMGRRGKISFNSPQVSEITLDLTTHLPDLRRQPLELEFVLN